MPDLGEVFSAGVQGAVAGSATLNPWISGGMALGNAGFNLFNQLINRKEQRSLNKIQQNREDTAYQRAVADAHRAGLSKAAIGGPSSSTALTAPSALQSDFAERSIGAMMNALSMQQQKADITKTMQEANNIAMQNSKMRTESAYWANNALNESQILATNLGLKQYEHDTLQKSLETLRQAQIGYINGQTSYLEVETDLKKVDRAFALIREHTLLGSQRGEYSQHNANIVFDKRTQYRLMLLNQMQSSIAQSMAQTSQYNADKWFFDDVMSNPTAKQQYKDSKLTSGMFGGVIQGANSITDRIMKLF